MAHRDTIPRFSARSVRRDDAGYREAYATLSKSLGMVPFRSPMRPARGHGVSPLFNGGGRPRDPRGRQKNLPMSHIACVFLPTRWTAWAISTGYYHCILV